MNTACDFPTRRQFEQLGTEERHTWQVERLNRLLSEILPRNRFYANKLDGVSLPIQSLDELPSWPLTTKDELIPKLPGDPPNHLTYEPERYVRFHRTSGTHGHPLSLLDTAEDWQWWLATWQYVLDAADVKQNDIAAMAFSFGPFIGFWTAHDALVQRGAMVIPCGGMSTIARLDTIVQQRATVLCCTPSYALHLAAVGEQQGLKLANSSVAKIIVAGEPGGSLPAVRQRIESAWGATVVDHAGATEIGPWGYAAEDHSGLHIAESEFIPEFVTLSDQQPAAPGDLAELVLTTLGRAGAPVIRYRTGDLVKTPALPAEESDHGATRRNQFALLDGGVLGRVDDMMIIRGVNVYPSAIERIVREFSEVQEYRMTATKAGEMDALSIEVEDLANDPDRISQALKIRLGLHVEVRCVPPNSLPRFELKGKRFVDLR